jgi:hypothetical protein
MRPLAFWQGHELYQEFFLPSARFLDGGNVQRSRVSQHRVAPSFHAEGKTHTTNCVVLAANRFGNIQKNNLQFIKLSAAGYARRAGTSNQ